jgi:glucose-6-phosphate 1-epimerase
MLVSCLNWRHYLNGSEQCAGHGPAPHEMTSTELNERFAISGALQFETAPGGLMCAVIATPLAIAEIYLHGAHVTQWIPRGKQPVLFLSSRSAFAPDKAIRGGVPVIFPWFGPRADGKPGPAHGFARTTAWNVERAQLLDTDALEIAFGLAPNDESRALGFDHFAVRFTVTVGSELTMSLAVTNQGAASLVFEEALHSYFTVSDIRGVEVRGLEGTTYIDKTDSMQRKVQPESPIRFVKETDQLHLNTTATCAIHDAQWNRRIAIRKTGSNSTVVWNPWIAKTAALGDMAPDEWERMVCLETVNAADNAVTLAPGGTHQMTAAISIA